MSPLFSERRQTDSSHSRSRKRDPSPSVFPLLKGWHFGGSHAPIPSDFPATSNSATASGHCPKCPPSSSSSSGIFGQDVSGDGLEFPLPALSRGDARSRGYSAGSTNLPKIFPWATFSSRSSEEEEMNRRCLKIFFSPPFWKKPSSISSSSFNWLSCPRKPTSFK